MADYETLGERIVRAYQERGMNRSQFQRALGVAYSTILNWEHGRVSPHVDQLIAISEVLEMSVAELLGEKPPPGRSRKNARRHTALQQFLGSPLANDVTADERRTLASVEFHGVEPTVATYHGILLGVRAGRRPGKQSGRPRRARRKQPRSR